MYAAIHGTNNSERTLQKYRANLELKSRSTQKLFKVVMDNIAKFGQFDVETMKKYDEERIYDLLQGWIIWNSERGAATSTIKCYLRMLRSALWYFGVRLVDQDVRHHLVFPQILHQEPVPISQEMIKNILSYSQHEFRFQLLALISSGMRASELSQIRAEHLDLSHTNIVVRLSAQLTKTGRSRTTFFTKQVSSMIRYRIKQVGSNDFSFCGNRTPEQARDLILKRFSVARKKAGLIQKHDHCNQNRYMIHVHGIRAYFITQANKTQFGIGHILAGHSFYMKEYNRYTLEDMLHIYKKFEKNLTF